MGHPLPKSRVPARGVGGGERERSDGLPRGRTPAQEPKKRSEWAAERDEFLRLLWRMEVGPPGVIALEDVVEGRIEDFEALSNPVKG